MPLPTQSVTDKILAAITANIQAAFDAASVTLTVERSRRRPSGPDELPMVTTRPLTERVQKIGTGIRVPGVERHLQIGVVIRVKGQDAALDGYRTLVIQGAMSDLSVGGLAIEVSETEHDWEADDASDADYTQDVVTFEVRYQTARTTTVSK